MRRRKKKKARGPKLRFVVVNNRSYGNRLKGIRIFYEGSKPKNLSKDGKIQFGKHVLELLTRKYRDAKFHWIITEETDSITTERGIIRIRTSQRLLTKLNSRLMDRTRDIKNDLLRNMFAATFPTEFSAEDEVWGYAAHNLMEGVVLPDVKRVQRFFLSQREIQLILAKAQEPHRTWYGLAAETGLEPASCAD
jgi:hypothetical protein